MKKTYNINLNGQTFHLDEDACAHLQSYIETLERYYFKEEDGKEIMTDIESRIAELFHDFLVQSHKEVISLEEINKVIEIMGSPDDIIDGDTEKPASSKLNARKLYRDTDNGILGGVAFGLAANFSIDSLWIRLAFILSAFYYGATILIYIILWIVIPKAKTAKEKLEMKGEKINVSNIEKNIRYTCNKVRQDTRFRSFINQVGYQTSKILSLAGNIINRLITATGHILAIVCAIGGTFWLLLTSWIILTGHNFIPANYYMHIQSIYPDIPLGVFKLILLLLLEIPVFLITYYSYSYLFKFRIRRTVLFISVIIWFCSIFAGFYFCINFMAHHADSYSNKKEIVLSTKDSQSLNVYFNNIHYPDGDTKHTGHGNSYLHPYIKLPGSDSARLYFKPQIYIEPTDENQPQLILIKEINSSPFADITQGIENIKYRYEWKNDTLYLNNYFTLLQSEWNLNKVKLKIQVPENYQLNIKDMLPENISNQNIFKDPGKFRSKQSKIQHYIMKDGKLTEN